METRKELTHDLIETVVYQAMLESNTGNCEILVRTTKKELERAVNVWLQDSNYSLVNVEEVTRKQIKIGD